MKRFVDIHLLAVWGLLAAACGSTTAGESPPAEDAGDVTVAADASDATDSDTTSNDADPSPTGRAWYQDAVFYEIFVRSFADSNGDGIGDIQGLIGRLDYLNDGQPGQGDDLEVDALWLMPLFRSPSYHGYDVADYLNVAEAYGTNDDLSELVQACHERGMRVILDFVMNHTSSQHPWFVDSRSGADAELRNYYVWRDDDPGWTQPWSSVPVWHASGGAFFYGLFWQGMPDLNYREPAVVEAMSDVALHWLEVGVDGYRIDAVRYLVEDETGGIADIDDNHLFLQEFRETLRTSFSEAYLVGEAWTARTAVTEYFGEGDELAQAFDFDLLTALEATLEQGNASWVHSELAKIANGATPWSFEATFLSNHDMDRLARRLSQDWQRRAAMALLLTLPGTPYLYYGDELGMAASTGSGDEAKRSPMAWDDGTHAGFTTGTPWSPLSPGSDVINVASQLADPDSLINHVRWLIRLRHAERALGASDGLAVVAVEVPGLLAFLRHAEDSVLLVVLNVSGSDVEAGALDLSSHSDLLGSGPWAPDVLLGEGEASPVQDLGAFPAGDTLGAGQVRVLRLR